MVELEAEPRARGTCLTSLQRVQPDCTTARMIRNRSERLRADPAALMRRQQQEVLKPVLIAVWAQSDATDQLTADADGPRAGWIDVAEEPSSRPRLVPDVQPLKGREADMKPAR